MEKNQAENGSEVWNVCLDYQVDSRWTCSEKNAKSDRPSARIATPRLASPVRAVIRSRCLVRASRIRTDVRRLSVGSSDPCEHPRRTLSASITGAHRQAEGRTMMVQTSRQETHRWLALPTLRATSAARSESAVEEGVDGDALYLTTDRSRRRKEL